MAIHHDPEEIVDQIRREMMMKFSEKQIAQHDLFNAIVADFNYPKIDAFGNVYRCSSWVLSDALFARISFEEVLCAALKHSDGEVFQLDKTLQETTIRKEFPAAKAFYDWMSLGLRLLPLHYETSEQSRLLDELASKLCLSAYLFQQHDPLCILNESGLRQGELINAFGRRVYERLTKKALKEAVTQCKRELSSLMAKTERYLHRLSTNYPGMVPFRFELQYAPEHALSVSLEETAAHLSALISALSVDDADGVGRFWWKRRYIPECGFGHHFIYFGDACETDVMKLHETWRSSSNGKGFSILLSHSPNDCRSLGSGLYRGVGADPMEQVAQSVRMMLASERYLRLTPHRKYPHVGMGELPAALPRDEAWSSSAPMSLI